MFKKFFALLFFILVTAVFFYKTFLHGFVPFPGDLLIAEYNPWKTYSYMGYNPGSFPNKAQYFDVLRQLYPWRTLVIDSIKHGQFPLWNPYNFSGTPLFANFQSAVLYPLSFVYFILPQIFAWSLLVFLQPFLASLFTYLYCKKIKLSDYACMFAGFTFGFSSFMSVWLQYNTIGHVIIWLPLILLAIENLKEKKSMLWSWILVFGLVSSLFGGHPQLFSYVFLFSCIYFFVQRKCWKRIGLFFLLSLGIGAVQLLPGIELIINSARSPHNLDFFYNKILIQWWQLVMIFVPDFFGNPATRSYWVPDTFVGDVIYFGIVPLLFIPFSFKEFKTNAHVKFYIASAIILLALITLNPISFVFYRIPIPSVLGSGVNFLVFLLIFSSSVLSGFGIDNLRKKETSIKQVVKFALIPILFFTIVELLIKVHFFVWSDNLASSIKPLLYFSTILYASLILIFISRKKSKLLPFVFIILFLIQIADLFKFFQKFNPFVPVETVFPKAEVAQTLKKDIGINRYFGYSSAYIEANFDSQLGLYSPNGYDPLYPKTYGQFVHLSADGTLAKEFDISTRSDAVISQAVNDQSLRVINMLGVSEILNRPKNEWVISKNNSAKPRFFLTSDYKIYNNEKEFEKLFSDVDLGMTILLSEKPGMEAEKDPTAIASLVSYGSNKVVIKTQSQKNQFLFLSDQYFPGWKAYIDDEETKIFRADYTFRAVEVPNGVHDVSFIYSPESFRLGKWISVLSFFILVAFSARRKIFRYNR